MIQRSFCNRFRESTDIDCERRIEGDFATAIIFKNISNRTLASLENQLQRVFCSEIESERLKEGSSEGGKDRERDRGEEEGERERERERGKIIRKDQQD